jgi:hypothetical protein
MLELLHQHGMYSRIRNSRLWKALVRRRWTWVRRGWPWQPHDHWSWFSLGEAGRGRYDPPSSETSAGRLKSVLIIQMCAHLKIKQGSCLGRKSYPSPSPAPPRPKTDSNPSNDKPTFTANTPIFFASNSTLLSYIFSFYLLTIFCLISFCFFCSHFCLLNF